MRARFPEGMQRDFLEVARVRLQKRWTDVANLCKVHPRTLLDWRKEKFNMSSKAVRRLSETADLELSQITLLPEHWSVVEAASLGAVARYALYGNPGTPDGRKKGGLISQRQFARNPVLALERGFVIRKSIKRPKPCVQLAELIGIILGDGQIAHFQVKVHGNGKFEQPYLQFVRSLFSDLFGVDSTISLRKKNALVLTVSSRDLVNYLQSYGMNKGNKIRNRLVVPSWIYKKLGYIQACLRGLMDTDGGIYFHTHTTQGFRYRHMGMCFTSYSPPLLRHAFRMFKLLGYRARCNDKGRIYLYSRKEVERYMKEIGSHNSHLIERFKSYKTSKLS